MSYKSVTFVWSPEGKTLKTYYNTTLEKAVKAFKRQYKNYAKYMGEVYYETEPATFHPNLD